MADEISLNVTLQVNKGSISISRNITDMGDMAGSHFSWQTQSIDYAAHEALAISSDVANKGQAIFRNLDATNYVDIGLVISGTFYPFARVLPGGKPQAVDLVPTG